MLRMLHQEVDDLLVSGVPAADEVADGVEHAVRGSRDVSDHHRRPLTCSQYQRSCTRFGMNSMRNHIGVTLLEARVVAVTRRRAATTLTLTVSVILDRHGPSVR